MVAKPVIYIKTNYLLQTNFAYKKYCLLYTSDAADEL